MYRLVSGTIELTIKSPKGRRAGLEPASGTVPFRPAAPGLLEGLGRPSVFSEAGLVEVRLEGISCLELRHRGPSQLLSVGLEARDRLMADAGFESVAFVKTNALRVRSTTPESVPAFIQTRGVDPAGRPIAFVFAGHSRRRSGFVGLLPPARMRRSLNARLLRAGLAYPCFYEGLPIPLRGALAGMAAKAVSSGLGLWSLDATGTRLRVRGVAALEKVALWPKLFRRLVAYFEDGGKGLAGLPAWLAAAPEERDDEVTVLSTGERTRLSAILDVEEGALAMKVPPVDLVIRPR